jgi:hypothetical protein
MQLLVHAAVRLRALINNHLGSEFLNWRRRSCAFVTGPAAPGLARGLVPAGDASGTTHACDERSCAARRSPDTGGRNGRAHERTRARAGDGENGLESRVLAVGAAHRAAPALSASVGTSWPARRCRAGRLAREID